MLSVRIVSVDSYISNPINGLDPTYSNFRGTTVAQVPVIRVFGITPDGIKTCVHIHGVLPYIYIPLDENEENPDGYVHRLLQTLEDNINNQLEPKGKKHQIFKITQVIGIPFYGYHSKSKTYLKIFFYRPSVVKQAVHAFESGGMFDKTFQPHEAHVPYILQFFMDYNLYGMSYLNLSKYTQRIDHSVSSETQPKLSSCQLEVDALTEDILNPQSISGDNTNVNPGLAYIWEEEKARRRINGNLSQISLCKYDNPITYFHSSLELELKAELIKRLQNHLKAKKRVKTCLKKQDSSESSNSGILEASFVESHSQNIHIDSLMDSQVRNLLQGFIQMWDEEETSENRPEEDSVLGIQIDNILENDEIEEAVHLSQPMDESEALNLSQEDVFFEDAMYSEPGPSHKGLNSDLSFLNSSIEKTPPKKVKSPQKKKTPPRYKALDIIIKKSPQKLQETKLKHKKSNLRNQILSKCFKDSQSPAESNSLDETFNDNTMCRTSKRRLSYENATIPGISDNNSSQELNLSQTSITSFYNMNMDLISDNKVLVPLMNPPTLSETKEYLRNRNMRLTPEIKPFYSSFEDITTSKEIGLTKVSIRNINSLDEFVGTQGNLASVHDYFYKRVFNLNPENETPDNYLNMLTSKKKIIIATLLNPPNFKDAKIWLEQQSVRNSIKSNQNTEYSQNEISSIESFEMKTILESKTNNRAVEETTVNLSGSNSKARSKSITNLHTYLTILCMEVHVLTRGALNPDPQHDSIAGIFFIVKNDVPDDHEIPQTSIVCITLSDASNITVKEDISFVKVDSEFEMIIKLVEFVHKENPDILAGYEIERSSWGYLIQRATVIGINLTSELGRIPNLKPDIFITDDLKITGRIVLNIWRMLRHEIAVMSYTFENMMYHLLNTRVPHYSYQTLTKWWSHFSNKFRDLTVEYYVTRIKGIIQILDSLDLIGRTSELASLFGIQFFEVLSRGSQFRVESMMLRLSKRSNFVAVSPNINQRAQMRAPASLPLIMEPQSRFYTDPVIVLDFQSLYPSMMIAYNYCFSTCLGRVEDILINDEITFGCTKLKVDYEELFSFKDHIHISPCGVAFVDSNVRKGILPRMLEEILETRLMVKRSMGRNKDNKKLYKVLFARQLGLKLIANVTYGYTSANFSGRMPCIEVGDSVVSKGRETLERTIKLVNETKKWGAQVVYGDTDSLFVLCPGKTKQEAFAIGGEIADAVTQSNPKPVKLKLEKVYMPCLLQTKKRYVGYMYETPEQEKPQFEAKGIETVRRDGCVAASKILEKSLKILFETYDVSKVKNYVCSQLTKITDGTLSIQDLTFGREYRGLNGYQPNACVPSLKLVKEWLLKDPRSEPRAGERVGYVIIYGHPGLPIIRLVRSPHEFLSNPSLQINSEYYITKVILPPLQRCFTLIGADVFAWYKGHPKKRKEPKMNVKMAKNKRETISQYFGTSNCVVCSQLCTDDVCAKCLENPGLVALKLTSKWSLLERRLSKFDDICGSCSGRNYQLECDSLDCPVYFAKSFYNKSKDQIEKIQSAMSVIFPEDYIIQGEPEK